MDKELLERVKDRLAGATDDEQLENVIKQLLCPVLLKLKIDDQQVRALTLEVLSYFNRRIRASTQVRLPLGLLISQYTMVSEDPRSFMLNFTMSYIQQAWQRETDTELKLSLLGSLLNRISSRPDSQQRILLHLITSV